jgi:hypothetical protein
MHQPWAARRGLRALPIRALTFPENSPKPLASAVNQTKGFNMIGSLSRRVSFRVFLCFIAVAVIGCVSTTTPEQRTIQQQKRIAKHEADEQRQSARREADEQKREAEERRHAEEDLRHKYARYTTAELKLMDTRYKELRIASGRDLNLNVGAQRLIFEDSDKENAERVIEIERELLRRWKAGDKEAYLAEFESVAPAK